MAYDPNRDTCANCLHFYIKPDEPASEEYGQVGECHRRPPTYITIYWRSNHASGVAAE